MKIILASVVTLLLQSVAMADIVPKNFKNGDRYVKVERDENLGLTFKDCIKGQEARTCKPIQQGNYSLVDLKMQDTCEELQMVGLPLAMFGTVVAAVKASAAFGGGTLLTTLALSNPVTAGIGTPLAEAIVGGLISLGGVAISASTTDRLNPIKQYDQAQLITKQLLQGDTVQVDDINETIKDLNFVLGKIGNIDRAISSIKK